MDPALFSKLAPQVAELAEIAYLHILGEALLHPDLERITAFAKEAGLPLGITTNGTLFDHPNARILEDPVYRRLNISLHSGVTDSELERIFEFSEELLSTNANVHIDYRLWDRGSDRSVRERIADRYPVVRETPADGGKECSCSGVCFSMRTGRLNGRKRMRRGDWRRGSVMAEFFSSGFCWTDGSPHAVWTRTGS